MIYLKKFVLLAAAGLTLTSSVHALTIPEARETLKETRNEFRDAKKDLREEFREKIGTRQGMLKNALRLRDKAAIGSGQVTAKSGTTLTVTSEGKTITVQTDAKTHFRFKFWGKGSLDAIAVGHTVNVVGKWTDDAQTTMLARQVRDLSLQKRFGVFVGEIKSLLTGGWIMSTKSEKRADQTVAVSSSTKFVNRKEEVIAQTDIVVGHKIRVKGLWDNVANTVTEVTHVKDFSLPVVVTTPTP